MSAVQGRGPHSCPVALSICSLLQEGSSWFLRRKECVKCREGGPAILSLDTHRRDQPFSSLLLLWRTQTLFFCVITPSAPVSSSQGLFPYSPLWVFSLQSPLEPFTSSLVPSGLSFQSFALLLMSSDSHLSAIPSRPLALTLAPAPAASRAPRAPRTSRAVGTPRRIATSGRAGAGALAMAQEAWSAVWKPGLFCSTTQKCS